MNQRDCQKPNLKKIQRRKRPVIILEIPLPYLRNNKSEIMDHTHLFIYVLNTY